MGRYNGGFPGMGGGNMNQLLRQAKKMQEDISELQIFLTKKTQTAYGKEQTPQSKQAASLPESLLKNQTYLTSAQRTTLPTALNITS